MPNAINRTAVCQALNIPTEYGTVDIFKRLVAGGFVPAPIDASYETYDITAVAAKVGSVASITAAAVKFANEHRGGPKAVF